MEQIEFVKSGLPLRSFELSSVTAEPLARSGMSKAGERRPFVVLPGGSDSERTAGHCNFASLTGCDLAHGLGTWAMGGGCGAVLTRLSRSRPSVLPLIVV